MQQCMQRAFRLPGTHVLTVDEGLPRFSDVIFSHIVFADKSVGAFFFWEQTLIHHAKS